MSDRLHDAKVLIIREADPVVAEIMFMLIVLKRAKWIFDPHVPGVVGLVHHDPAGRSTNEAYIVVYENDDWELGEEMERLLASAPRRRA